MTKKRAAKLTGIVTADFHLQGMDRILGETALEQQLATIDKIFAYAVENGINHVFVPGDICHTPFMTDRTLIALIRLIKQYDTVLNVYYIAGNHDFCSTQQTSMDVLQELTRNKFFARFSLTLQQTRACWIDGVPVQLLPFPQHVAKPLRVPTLNFAHVEYSGAINDNGSKMVTKRSFAPRAGDFTFSGHLHTHQQHRHLVYCGSPYPTKFGENPLKGFLCFEAIYYPPAGNEPGVLQVEYEQVATRPSFNLHTLHIKSLDGYAALKKAQPSDYYSLKIAPAVPVPADLTVRYANIVTVTGIGDPGLAQLGLAAAGEVTATGAAPPAAVSPLFGLQRWLRQRDFTAAEVKQGKTIVRDILGQLSQSL